jgi:hypothetical protein
VRFGLAERLLVASLAAGCLPAASIPGGVAKSIGTAGLLTVESPYKGYVLKLTSFFWRDGKPVGFALRARVNDGPDIHLLIDTGARNLLISQSAARKLNLEDLGPSWVEGFGSERWGARAAVAQRLQVGHLVLRNVPVDVSAEKPVPDLDGVIGVEVFRDFLIRINGPKRILELTPYSEPAREPDGFYPFQQVGHLILVPVRVNRRHEGQFLLDSGAFYSAVDPHWSAQTPASAYVQGVGGAVGTLARTFPVELELAGRSSWESEVVAMDLRPISDRHGVPITGLIGYPALARSVLTLDLREKRLRISDR